MTLFQSCQSSQSTSNNTILAANIHQKDWLSGDREWLSGGRGAIAAFVGLLGVFSKIEASFSRAKWVPVCITVSDNGITGLVEGDEDFEFSWERNESKAEVVHSSACQLDLLSPALLSTRPGSRRVLRLRLAQQCVLHPGLHGAAKHLYEDGKSSEPALLLTQLVLMHEQLVSLLAEAEQPSLAETERRLAAARRVAETVAGPIEALWSSDSEQPIATSAAPSAIPSPVRVNPATSVAIDLDSDQSDSEDAKLVALLAPDRKLPPFCAPFATSQSFSSRQRPFTAPLPNISETGPSADLFKSAVAQCLASWALVADCTLVCEEESLEVVLGVVAGYVEIIHTTGTSEALPQNFCAAGHSAVVQGASSSAAPGATASLTLLDESSDFTCDLWLSIGTDQPVPVLVCMHSDDEATRLRGALETPYTALVPCQPDDSGSPPTLTPLVRSTLLRPGLPAIKTLVDPTVSAVLPLAVRRPKGGALQTQVLRSSLGAATIGDLDRVVCELLVANGSTDIAANPARVLFVLGRDVRDLSSATPLVSVIALSASALLVDASVPISPPINAAPRSPTPPLTCPAPRPAPEQTVSTHDDEEVQSGDKFMWSDSTQDLDADSSAEPPADASRLQDLSEFMGESNTGDITELASLGFDISPALGGPVAALSADTGSVQVECRILARGGKVESQEVELVDSL